MVEIGYALSSEEHSPNDLVRNAQRAEQLGFRFALISDHFHPWTEQQGQSSFVWSVLGAIAHATTSLRIGTGVTCPIIRIHPVIIAQAAATVAKMMPNRFFLGLGTGEALNEHIFGDHWPSYELRSAMLEEAIEIIRLLWQGETTTYYGTFYAVEDARIYTIPDTPPQIMLAADGKQSAELAGEFADGLISTSPKAELVETFSRYDKTQRPRYGMLKICCDTSKSKAVKTALKWWPTAALGGELGQVLPRPLHFEQATKRLREEDIEEVIVCGNEPDAHRKKIQDFMDAGFDHVYVHQVGPDQDACFQFYEREILPYFHGQKEKQH
jgi:coenzyme F420-dependent glucose-6-phosphate dehydrogenase